MTHPEFQNRCHVTGYLSSFAGLTLKFYFTVSVDLGVMTTNV